MINRRRFLQASLAGGLVAQHAARGGRVVIESNVVDHQRAAFGSTSRREADHYSAHQ